MKNCSNFICQTIFGRRHDSPTMSSGMCRQGPCKDFYRHFKQQGPKHKPCKNPAETGNLRISRHLENMVYYFSWHFMNELLCFFLFFSLSWFSDILMILVSQEMESARGFLIGVLQAVEEHFKVAQFLAYFESLSYSLSGGQDGAKEPQVSIFPMKWGANVLPRVCQSDHSVMCRCSWNTQRHVVGWRRIERRLLSCVFLFLLYFLSRALAVLMGWGGVGWGVLTSCSECVEHAHF